MGSVSVLVLRPPTANLLRECGSSRRPGVTAHRGNGWVESPTLGDPSGNCIVLPPIGSVGAEGGASGERNEHGDLDVGENELIPKGEAHELPLVDSTAISTSGRRLRPNEAHTAGLAGGFSGADGSTGSSCLLWESITLSLLELIGTDLGDEVASSATREASGIDLGDEFDPSATLLEPSGMCLGEDLDSTANGRRLNVDLEEIDPERVKLDAVDDPLGGCGTKLGVVRLGESLECVSSSWLLFRNLTIGLPGSHISARDGYSSEKRNGMSFWGGSEGV